MGWLIFDIFAITALAFVLFLGVLVLFEPGLQYSIKPRPLAMESEEFVRLLGALCDAQLHGHTKVQPLENGDQFYPAELAAIRAAKHTINLEAYQFRTGRVGSEFIEALAERARAGVRVKLVVDAIGSLFTPNKFFNPISAAGGRVVRYQPLRWDTFKRWNNRTHRKLIVIDGQIAFAGGADIADEWLYDTKKKGPRWRDTVFRYEGNMVSGLQSTFAENWLEASGSVLADDDYFPRLRAEEGLPPGDSTAAMVVNSAPTAARGSRAAILFQMMLAYSQRTIHITTPYFLPDRSSLGEMVKAAKERGVKVVVLTPGKRSDHLVTRASARRRYGELLKAGIEVYEYKPSMIHAKLMVLDSLWCVVGSTNFDNRSLGLNDEVNVALRNTEVAARLEEDFRRDLENSERITMKDWENRRLMDKMLEVLFRLFDRQF